MKYKAAIFDMDGTILDTLEDLANAMNYELRKNGMPERTIDEVRRFVGNGIRKLVERATPEGTAERKIDEITADFLEYYQQNCEYFAGLFDTAIGERDGIARKPAPDSVHEILCRFNLPKEEAVYIGDSDVDLNTAKNAGLDFIGADWGFRGKDFLLANGATRVAMTAADVARFILES